MTFGSLFAGIGGFDLGFERNGMRGLWQVEIDPQCRRVLERHFPHAERFADVRSHGARNLPLVDVLCGGFPCQDLSIAGKRGGLKGERSGLFFEFARIVGELRPELVVFENVPGLLSANGGADSLMVLRVFTGLGFCGGWRVLDSQYFGVAQRRDRVFGVFARGRAGAGRAAEILALCESGARHSPASQEARKGVAAGLRSRSHSAGVSAPGRGGEDDQNLICAPITGSPYADNLSEETRLVASAITAGCGKGASVNDGKRGSPKNLILYEADDYAAGTFAETNCARPITTSPDRSRAAPIVVGAIQSHSKEHGHAMTTQQAAEAGQLVSFALNGKNGKRYDSESETFVTHSLSSEGADASEDGTGRGVPLTVFSMQERMESVNPNNGPNGKGWSDNGIAFTLESRRKPQSIASPAFGVRRLMPVECLRLQGFPDDWLDLDPPLSDSAKYRMIGNAVTVSVAQWLGKRMTP